MNSDEIKTFVSAAALVAGAILATHGVSVSPEGMSAIINEATTMISAGVSLVGGIIVIYRQWNMKKVSENAVAVEAHSDASPAVKTNLAAAVETAVAPIGKVVGVALLAIIVLASEGHAAQQTPINLDPLNIAGKVAAANSGVAATFQATQANLLALAKKIQALAATDLDNAVQMATTANTAQSGVRLTCYNAIKSYAMPAAITIPDPHLISDAEWIAEIIEALQTNSPMMVKCGGAAQLVGQDALSFINNVAGGAAAAAIVAPIK